MSGLALSAIFPKPQQAMKNNLSDLIPLAWNKNMFLTENELFRRHTLGPVTVQNDTVI